MPAQRKTNVPLATPLHTYGPNVSACGGPISSTVRFTPELSSPQKKQQLENFAKSWRPVEQNDLSSADYYFNSYAHFGIHEEMLKDVIRTGSYQRAIQQNAHLFKDKIVMDVGSGTGILCLFAASAGAKKVIGIECSEIVEIARRVSKANNLDGVVTFVQGKAEEVDLEPIKLELGIPASQTQFVDIIISEWMGYFLLYESMLDTVLLCRDKFLKPEGHMFPDRATLHLAAIEDGEYKDEKLGFWNHVYGFDFRVMKSCVMEEPIVDVVDSKTIVTDSSCVLDIDLKKVKVGELDFTAHYRLTANRDDFLHAFVAWFDVCFSACHRPILFTTSPFGQYTHWKQTVFYMEDVLTVKAGDVVSGLISVRKSSQNPRDLDIKLSYDFNGSFQKISTTQFYRLR